MHNFDARSQYVHFDVQHTWLSVDNFDVQEVWPSIWLSVHNLVRKESDQVCTILMRNNYDHHEALKWMVIMFIPRDEKK